MMNRTLFIENRTNIDDNGTKTIDLNIPHPVTKLTVVMEADNHSTGPNSDNRLAECISKIEITSGSNVLYSLSGLEAQAAYFYNTRQMPFHTNNERASASQVETFPIMFGRILNDPDFALDPTRHSNLQLKVTWNLGTITAVGANGYATNTAKITVLAEVMENAPNIQGFFQMKTVYDYQTGSSGEERIPMPVDKPYRKMFVRVYKAATSMESIITKFKLTFDQDSFIPYDEGLEEAIYNLSHYYPKAALVKHTEVDDAQVVKSHIGYQQDSMIFGEEATSILALTTDSANQVTVSSVGDDGAAENNINAKIVNKGYCPNNTLAFCFGRWNVPSEYLKFDRFGQFQTVLTQGVADAKVVVFIEQLHTY